MPFQLKLFHSPLVQGLNQNTHNPIFSYFLRQHLACTHSTDPFSQDLPLLMYNLGFIFLLPEGQKEGLSSYTIVSRK